MPTMTPPSLQPIRQRLAAACSGLLGCVLAVMASLAQAQPQAGAAAQLQLQARLFHSASGGFSADVLAPGGPDLVNVVASDDPSSATLVVVVVTLASGTLLPADTPVRLVVRDQPARGGGQRLVLDRRQPLGLQPRGGTVHLAFWLQGTGCRPLQLQARMAVAGDAVPLSASAALPFACGE